MIEIEAPDEYLCPLTLDVMSDPVMSKYGQSFERSEILQWLKAGHGVCPLSRRPLSLQDLVTNHALRLKISEWRKEHGEEEIVVVKPSPSQVYGFITLPNKDDDTDRTIDEEEDLFVIQLAAFRIGQPALPGSNATQQSQANTAATRRRRHRQRRASTGSTRSPQEGQRQRRSSITRPLRGLRNFFVGSSA